MTFQPKDPNFENRVRAGVDRQAALKTLGVKILDIQPGAVSLGMPHAAALTQQHGFLHAGIVSTALDSACGYAAFSLMPDNAAVLTVEFKINLLAPARGQYFHFLGRVIKPGRTITVCDGEAWGFDDGKKTLIATMHGTIMALFDRPGLD